MAASFAFIPARFSEGITKFLCPSGRIFSFELAQSSFSFWNKHIPINPVSLGISSINFQSDL